ncbi:MAG: valine--tRNA ligase [Actinomycetota bacterium]
MKSDASLERAYDPSSLEKRWYETWVERGYFAPNPKGAKGRFCIVLPPPNVTGALHIGHALDHTLQDVIVRRKRMQGFETLWLPGTDHAGIGTEVIVKRTLRDEGVDPIELGRERFVERVWEWKERYGGMIVEQMKRLGNSCDWDRLRFTMDEGLQHAVRVAFVRLYEDGLIYRGERIINWCPTDQTALSDSEVEHEEVDGELIRVRYPVKEGGDIEIATTRVETMLADTGVAVHPADPRYVDLVGKTALLPIVGRELPIVADEAIDPEFGSGALKVTPGHDQTDFEIAERHGLPTINVLNADATLNEEAPTVFRGMNRYEARRAVLEGLREEGVVVSEERPYRHAVGHCYRCGSEIEPWLSGKQWFVAVDRLKGQAKEAADTGRVTFVPERWKGPYATWLENLRDWNISRQLWWGHRIPVWYCDNGHEFAAVEDPNECRECGSEAIEQDPDVLDTWFSSQLWPFSTLGWPEEAPDLARFYPTSVLVTGYEILYLWVARMIMAGLYLVGDVPFHQVFIHGLVRDEQNRKMSKSLGNVIDPLEFIDRYGADALRFALVRMASLDQQNLPLGERDVEASRHFANKLWNAARLVLGAHGGAPAALPDSDLLTLPERWLLSRLESCRAEVDDAFEAYRFADAVQALYRFLWSEFCDWGLELEKPRLYEGTPEERSSAASVLAWVLERTLRLLHPVMPFVSEEIWQRLGVGESIVISSWPEPHPEHRDEDAERRFSFAEDLVVAIRSFRSGHGIAQGAPLTVRVGADERQRPIVETLDDEIRRLARVQTLELADGPLDGAGSARLVVQGADVLIPLAGVLDPKAECTRIRNRLDVLAGRRAQAERKLANQGFVEKAPPEVVETERTRVAEFAREEETLRGQLAELGC